MSDTTKKKPGLSKKTQSEIKETFNAFRDDLGLSLQVIASPDGRATVVDEELNALPGMTDMSGLTLCRAIEVAQELVKYQTQFSAQHGSESLRSAPAQADEAEDFAQDLEDLDDEDDQAVAV